MRVMGVTAFALLLAARTVLGQAAANRLVGVYDPDSGEPIADVQIILLGTKREWRTSAEGLVLLRDLPAGEQLLRLRRIGYQPHTEFVSFSASDTMPLTLVLTPLGVLLPEVFVNAREERYALRMSGFLERRRSSGAPPSSFITEVDLERWGAVRWVDALSRVAGVRTNVRGEIGFRDCGARQIAVFLDGVALAGNVGDLNHIPLTTVAAVEVYRGAAQVPSQFNTTGRGCGAILVWTK